MHMYRHAHTHTNIHTIYGPSMWRKDLLLDLERLSTFYRQRNRVFMDLNWRILIFCVFRGWSLLVVSLGMFDIAALEPNWTTPSGVTWREDDGEPNWTEVKIFHSNYSICVNRGDCDVSGHCLDSLRSNANTVHTSGFWEQPALFLAVLQIREFHAGGTNWTFSACLRWPEPSGSEQR